MLKLFNHYFPTSAVFQVFVDATLLFLATVIAGVLMSKSLAVWPVVALPALLFSTIVVVLSTALGLYGARREKSIYSVVARVVLAVLFSVPVAYVVFHLMPWSALQPRDIEAAVVLALGGVLILRGVSRHRSTDTFLSRRVLVIGTGREAATVEHALVNQGHKTITIAGFYPVPGFDDGLVNPMRVLPAARSLLDTVRSLQVDEIIVAVRERRGGTLPLAELLDCKLLGVKVLDLSCFFERVRGQVRVDSLRASWLIYGDGFRQGMLRGFVKRSFDLVAATGLLVVTAPIMLLAMLAVVIEDGFPVFYSQERVGLGGRSFKVIKFRSMYRDAEKDGKPRWASTNDNRVTRVGRIMRKTRIDELPQLFNVLMGDMSMVGPRPERPYFVEQLAAEIPFYGVRHSVKPGVTGWAQVRYAYGASVDDAVQKLQYDLYYVKNHSLFLDMLVLAETVRVVVTGEGAH